MCLFLDLIKYLSSYWKKYIYVLRSLEEMSNKTKDSLCWVVSGSLWPLDCRPPGSSVHGIFQTRMLEMGCHFLPQGIFPIQGSNSCFFHLLHCHAGSLPLVPPGKSKDFLLLLVATLAYFWHAAAAKSLQSCPTLCDPIDGSPPGSPVPGILQTRTLEWVAISFSNAWKWKVKGKSVSLSNS